MSPHKRFRLSIVGPMDSQPRLIRAYGKLAGAEVALVMRPPEQSTLLVRIQDTEAWSWQSSSTEGDAPQAPSRSLTPEEAVALARTAQDNPPPEGPVALRGRWSGTLQCEDGRPVVELKRKLAAYGTLVLTSHQERGWSWRFERAERWYTEEGTVEGSGLATLTEAIEAGVQGAVGLVSPACSFRDTHRRAAHDAAYASMHPLRTPRPMRDPTQPLGRKRKRKRKRRPKPAEAAPKPPSVESTGSTPPPALKGPLVAVKVGRGAKVHAAWQAQPDKTLCGRAGAKPAAPGSSVDCTRCGALAPTPTPTVSADTPVDAAKDAALEAALVQAIAEALGNEP